jgi:polyadenylate-binding protein
MATQTAGPVVTPAAPSAPTATATGGTTTAPVGSSQYPMASLYVGDLHPNVTESMLYNKFAAAGPVLSIRVCRDAITRRSLGYAYVNFQQPQDAERALDTMNFDLMQNKAIRIMWSQRDPTIRRSGAGNIFIKNLDPHIDTKSIYDTFSMFGSILSCKIASDELGASKGYGFIHFETEEAAQKAIDKVNGMLLDNKVVFVGKFQPRAARLREMGEATHHFTNVFVKNFADKLDDAKLRQLFEKYGTISSCTVMKNSQDGSSSKGFGFVSFENPEDAERAVNELNGYELPDSDLKLTVCRAQKKVEREAELSRVYEQLKAERMQRYQGVNLYVKNLDESVTSDELKETFSQHGVVASAKVMMDESNPGVPARSKGFGFVCFEKPDDATKAVVEMNNRMLNGKPLYVALAQRKEERKAQLASQYMQRMATMRMQNSGAMPVFAQPNAGFYVQGGIPNQQQIRGNVPMQMRGGNLQRWNGGNVGYGAMPGYVQQQNFGHRGAARQQYQAQAGRQVGGRSQVQVPFGGRSQQPLPQVQSQFAPRQPPISQPPHHIRTEDLSSKLTSASPQEAKQLLGEHLYPLVAKLATTEQSGKLVGMLLEMDNSELLVLLDNPELLHNRVNEALSVLQQSKPSDI